MSMEKKDTVIPSRETQYLPVLPLKNVVALPRSIIPVIVGRDVSINAVEYALKHKKEVFVTAQKSLDTTNPSGDDIFHVGTRATILQASRLPNGTLKVLIEPLVRARIEQIVQMESYIGVLATDLVVNQLPATPATEALWRTLLDLFKTFAELSNKVPQEVVSMFQDSRDLDYLADTIAVHIGLKLEERQEVLEMVDLKKRVNHLIDLLKNEIEITKAEQKIRARVQAQVEKNQKDYYLQEQMRAIQQELGKDGYLQEIAQIRDSLGKLHLSQEAQEKVEQELNRLEQMQPTSPESAVSRNYIDWIVSLPWHQRSKDRVSIEQAEHILESSHAGMKKAKERVLEFIATKKFAKDQLKRSPIICLAGPPGVGKTSLARSIAKSLGREFIRISLGGMRDEAEIRGHRRTYIGAMPGKIIQAMRKAKHVNPVMLLDEIDKMSMDFRGDPASALLEVLDPELNKEFADYFLEVDYDLSNVMFVATANVIDNIPYPLFDRMEVINLSGYTTDEKFQIARKFLLPRLFEEHALKARQMTMADSVLLSIIEEYTKEAGVRQLERVLAKVVRKTIQEMLRNPTRKSVAITPERVLEWLGAPKYKKPEKLLVEHVGLANGLAWTEVGGDILEVEVTILKGKGSLQLTGQLGEVMRESAEAALSYVRSRAKEFNLDEDFYSDVDIHIHVPEGAIPKDGPSAGITMTVALISALTKTPIKKHIAMTGEVTLRGRVLAVGGLKEKLLAASRFGFTTVILPKENENDVLEFIKELPADLHIVYADHMDQVLAQAFDHKPVLKKTEKKKPEAKKTAKTAKKKPAAKK